MNPINHKILEKLKKVLRVLFLVVVGLILFFIATAFYFFLSGGGTVQKSTFLSKGFSDSVSNSSERGIPNGVNIALPDMGLSGITDESVFDYNAIPSQAPAPTLSASERKLIQNGALSLIVDRVEDAVTKLADIAEKLGGRIDSATLDNRGGTEKKHATVVMKVPAVNFGAGMEQIKGVARKVQSENISTEDITEKFIDMQARLKNLKAEEEQYLEIMKKALKIEDILKVSQKLYAVRQQIEQLQGQMNYLSRQVDMSVIVIDLSSDPDIVPTNTVWSPKTTMKEAMQGLIDGFYTFLKFAILFVGYLLPLLILWGAVIILIVWLMWKLLLNVKKHIQKM